jgi:hypothetical protein
MSNRVEMVCELASEDSDWSIGMAFERLKLPPLYMAKTHWMLHDKFTLITHLSPHDRLEAMPCFYKPNKELDIALHTTETFYSVWYNGHQMIHPTLHDMLILHAT